MKAETLIFRADRHVEVSAARRRAHRPAGRAIRQICGTRVLRRRAGGPDRGIESAAERPRQIHPDEILLHGVSEQSPRPFPQAGAPFHADRVLAAVTAVHFAGEDES